MVLNIIVVKKFIWFYAGYNRRRMQILGFFTLDGYEVVMIGQFSKEVI